MGRGFRYAAFTGALLGLYTFDAGRQNYTFADDTTIDAEKSRRLEEEIKDKKREKNTIQRIRIFTEVKGTVIGAYTPHIAGKIAVFAATKIAAEGLRHAEGEYKQKIGELQGKLKESLDSPPNSAGSLGSGRQTGRYGSLRSSVPHSPYSGRGIVNPAEPAKPESPDFSEEGRGIPEGSYESSGSDRGNPNYPNLRGSQSSNNGGKPNGGSSKKEPRTRFMGGYIPK